MGVGDWIIVGAVAVLLAGAVVFILRRRGRCPGGCGGCTGCPYSGQCGRERK